MKTWWRTLSTVDQSVGIYSNKGLNQGSKYRNQDQMGASLFGGNFRKQRNSKISLRNISLRSWKEGLCIVPSGETEMSCHLGWAWVECLISGRNHIQTEISSRHLKMEIFHLFSESGRSYYWRSEFGHTWHGSSRTKAGGGGSDSAKKARVERLRCHKDTMEDQSIQEIRRTRGSTGVPGLSGHQNHVYSFQAQWSIPLILSNDVLFGLRFSWKSTKDLYPANVY